MPAEKRRLLMRTWILLASIRLGLSLLPFRIVHRWTVRRAAVSAISISPDAILDAVRSASRFVPKASCLTQALAAQVLLTRCGHAAPRLHIGVAKDGQGRLEAHAWLEDQGKVILGGGPHTQNYTPLLVAEGNRL